MQGVKGFDRHFDNYGATPYEWESDWRKFIGEAPREEGKYVDLDVKDYDDYLDKAKLSRLPVIQSDLPKPTYLRNDIVVIIPIYDGGAAENLHNVFYKSAIWCMRSFLYHTTMIRSGIGMRFFVEEKLKQDFLPYLTACGLDESACIFFSDQGDGDGMFRKRTYMWDHPELQKYKTVLWVDSDMFASKGNHPINFFGYLTELLDIGYPPTLMLLFIEWDKSFVTPISHLLGFSSMDEFIETVAKATGFSLDTCRADIQGVRNGNLIAPMLYPRICTKMVWFPIQKFCDDPSFIPWVKENLPLFESDEALLATYLYKTKIPYYNLDNRFVTYGSGVADMYSGRSEFLDVCRS